MYVMITGGAGYIGSHVAKYISQLGHVPVVLDNLSTGHISNVRWGPLVIGDVGSPSDLHKALDAYPVEAVMHLAGSAYVEESLRLPGRYFQNNVANMVNLLNVITERRVLRIIFSSSCTVYGESTIPIDEDHHRSPLSPYGQSKLMGEQLLKWYEDAHGLKWVSLRFFNAAGADLDGELGERHIPETHLIPLALEASITGSIFHVYGKDFPTHDGTATRDFIHVADLAAAHFLALEHLLNCRRSLAFNLGSGCGFTVGQVLEQIQAVTGRRIDRIYLSRRAGDAGFMVANPRFAQSVLGWKSESSDLPTIVASAHRWMLSNGVDGLASMRPNEGTRR